MGISKARGKYFLTVFDSRGWEERYQIKDLESTGHVIKTIEKILGDGFNAVTISNSCWGNMPSSEKEFWEDIKERGQRWKEGNIG
jgi:hypothetical protein